MVNGSSHGTSGGSHEDGTIANPLDLKPMNSRGIRLIYRPRFDGFLRVIVLILTNTNMNIQQLDVVVFVAVV